MANAELNGLDCLLPGGKEGNRADCDVQALDLLVWNIAGKPGKPGKYTIGNYPACRYLFYNTVNLVVKNITVKTGFI